MESKVLRNLSYGMYVIGAKDEENVGCIVNTLVQITSDPKTIAVSINHDNYTNKIIQKTKKFSVSILHEKTDPKIIGIFGYKTSRDVNKYKDVETIQLENFPVLKDSCGSMICKVFDQIETSTHTVFFAEIMNMENYTDERPMTYRYYQEVLKGKSPKNAPTYVQEEVKSKKTVWKCSVCGYEVEMDELPADYLCPICGKPVDVFKKIEK